MISILFEIKWPDNKGIKTSVEKKNQKPEKACEKYDNLNC